MPPSSAAAAASIVELDVDREVLTQLQPQPQQQGSAAGAAALFRPVPLSKAWQHAGVLDQARTTLLSRLRHRLYVEVPNADDGLITMLDAFASKLEFRMFLDAFNSIEYLHEATFVERARKASRTVMIEELYGIVATVPSSESTMVAAKFWDLAKKTTAYNVQALFFAEHVGDEQLILNLRLRRVCYRLANVYHCCWCMDPSCRSSGCASMKKHMQEMEEHKGAYLSTLLHHFYECADMCCVMCSPVRRAFVLHGVPSRAAATATATSTSPSTSSASASASAGDAKRART